MKNINRIVTSLSTLSLFLFTAVQTYAQEAKVTINIDQAATDRFVPGGSITPHQVIRFIIIVLFTVAVLAAIVFLIWGGIKWIISGGDKGKVDSARGQIVAAIIGLIIVLLAFVILNFVISILGLGTNIFNLQIPTLTGK